MQIVLPFSDIASSLAHEQQLLQQERRGSTSSSTPRSPLSVRDIDDKRNTPLFRRDSTTEEILLPDLLDETCSSWGESSMSSMLSAIDEEDGSMKDLFASGFKTACNHLYETFTAPPSAAHQSRHDQKLLLALGQKGSERRKARAVMCNHDEFLKLKKELKESGMVTNYAARAVLNPIVESRAADLIVKNRRRQQRK